MQVSIQWRSELTSSKSFSTDNALQTHLQSKKHRDREANPRQELHSEQAPGASSTSAALPVGNGARVEDGVGEESEAEDEDDEEGEIEERLAAARRRIKPSDCLFCSVSSKSVPENVAHMSRFHSFFIPDQDILLDMSGLLSYLGEKVVLGNLCLFCPNGGKEFNGIEAVRRHMIDKSHCKIAYESNEDRAELADFYDYKTVGRDDKEWEDMSDADGEAAESEFVEVSCIFFCCRNHLIIQESGISIAPDGLSLLLPSGRTLGHRSLRVYYDQKMRAPTVDAKGEALSAKIKQLRANLADPSQALVPVAGGQGAFGRGLEVMKARNAGEAKWAKKQGRSFKDQRVREAHKTRVGFVHNNQKRELQTPNIFNADIITDFRDPLCKCLLCRALFCITNVQCNKASDFPPSPWYLPGRILGRSLNAVRTEDRRQV